MTAVTPTLVEAVFWQEVNACANHVAQYDEAEFARLYLSHGSADWMDRGEGVQVLHVRKVLLVRIAWTFTIDPLSTSLRASLSAKAARLGKILGSVVGGKRAAFGNHSVQAEPAIGTTVICCRVRGIIGGH